jgi:hypothetical protein
MALEDLTGPNKFISNLVPTNPPPSDAVEEGSFHLTGIKNVLLNSFPAVNGAVTATDEELSSVAGKLPLAGGTMTGPLGVLAPNGVIQYKRASDSAVTWDLNVDAEGDFYLYNRSRSYANLEITAADGLATFQARGRFNGALVTIGGTPSDPGAALRLNLAASGAPQWLVGIGGGVGASSFDIYNTTRAVSCLTVDAATDLVKINPAGIDVTRSGSPTRTDAGVTANGGAWEIGKAPGMARGFGVINAGEAAVIFPFNIPFPVVVCTALAAGNPVVAGVRSVSSGGFTIWAYEWTGVDFIPAANGTSVYWTAIDTLVDPG